MLLSSLSDIFRLASNPFGLFLQSFWNASCFPSTVYFSTAQSFCSHAGHFMFSVQQSYCKTCHCWCGNIPQKREAAWKRLDANNFCTVNSAWKEKGVGCRCGKKLLWILWCMGPMSSFSVIHAVDVICWVSFMQRSVTACLVSSKLLLKENWRKENVNHVINNACAVLSPIWLLCLVYFCYH